PSNVRSDCQFANRSFEFPVRRVAQNSDKQGAAASSFDHHKDYWYAISYFNLYGAPAMPPLNRREFLNTASSLAATGITASLAAGVSAADEVKKERPPMKLAIMGVNSRGKQLLPGFVEFPEVEIAYICDPDSETIPAAVKIVQDGGKPTPRIEKDFRVALDDPSVTALVCAAPDHWHA